ncbi:MAG: hypothetical protein HY241_06805 [Actinobacteria bacterium]|nr:hypothetical protein [Actinomycetota bacterium]
MTSDDDLRARLSRVDPLPTSVPVDPSTSPRVHELLERVMQTQMHDQTRTSTGTRWRKPALVAAAAAAAIALGVGAVVAASDGPATAPRAKTTLALKVAGGGTSLQSCAQFSIAVLQGFQMGFGGTVTTVHQGMVTLTVDHWYKGGTADVVTLTATADTVSLDGVDFIPGRRYLVTAFDGTVNGCGYTGEATAELERLFAEAFPS